MMTEVLQLPAKEKMPDSIFRIVVVVKIFMKI